MFLKNYPAMRLGEYLIVTDVHLGITKDIYDSGVLMPRQSKRLAEKLNKLKKITKTKKLILLGDVKHRVHGFSIREKYEIERFFELLDFRQITIVKGNHDGDIEKMLPRAGIKVKSSLAVKDYLFSHGHRRVETKKHMIVIGHNQPHVRFKDEMGAIYFEPVWVRGQLRGDMNGKELIIIPAFNELCGATVINRDHLLGPIAKQLIKSTAHAYLLDGTDLGTLADLKSKK